MLTIRHETATDDEAVFRVESDAFGQEDEARLVDELRAAGNSLLSLVDELRAAGNSLLSLVAELDGEIVGHIMFSPMTIESGDRSFPAVCLAPLAVATAHQRRGIGGQLIEAGLAELRAAGHGAVFVLGHPSYYPRLGFRPAREIGVHYQDDRDAFMAIELYPGALGGVIGDARFAPQFDPFT